MTFICGLGLMRYLESGPPHPVRLLIDLSDCVDRITSSRSPRWNVCWALTAKEAMAYLVQSAAPI